MQFEEILQLIDKLDTSKLEHLEYTTEAFSLKLGTTPVAAAPVQMMAAVPQKQDTPKEAGHEAPKEATQKEVVVQAKEDVRGYEVKAPIVGTFYESPAPDKPAFVMVGDRVKKGDVLCIIEAMKVMNEIVAEVSGEVLAVRAKNAELVEYNQVLFVVKES